MNTNRGKTVFVELTPELAEFLKNNCEVNLHFALANLQKMSSPDLIEKMVAQMENFKAVLKAVKEAT